MIVIRREESHDIAEIRAVHLAAFPGPTEARLVDALRDAGRLVVSLIAERAGHIVGHIAFSPLTIVGCT